VDERQQQDSFIHNCRLPIFSAAAQYYIAPSITTTATAMKQILPFVFFLISFNNLFAQAAESDDFEARPTSINQVIRQLGGDTVVFFYSDRWLMVKPVCAATFRITRLDTVQFTFTGKFADYYTRDSSIAVEGSYANGKKEGTFSLYYPNGQLDQSGQYANDKKTGKWEYFYEDGARRQVLNFVEDEVLIDAFWDEEGKKLVENGNGQWFGYESSERFMKISGEVANGRKNGTWKKNIPSRNMTTNVEKYKDGKLLSGKITSVVNGTQSYKDTTYCSIEQLPLFLMAEQFQVSSCSRLQKNVWAFAEYPGGMERFYRQIREKLVLTGPIMKRGVIKVIMTIAADGKMINFVPVSSLGYEGELIRVLETMDQWTPTKVNGKATTQPKIISFEIR
jgi:antitoxin component YwqK of YwqJK toxin-antitoxin module